MIYNVINEERGRIKSVWTFNNAEKAQKCKKWHIENGCESWIITLKDFDNWIE